MQVNNNVTVVVLECLIVSVKLLVYKLFMMFKLVDFVCVEFPNISYSIVPTPLVLHNVI